MVDVVLISPPSRAKSLRPPLGLMYISALLDKEGYSNEIIDLKSNKSLEEIKNKIVEITKKFNPKIVGISCMTPDVIDVIEISKKIKQETNAVIMVGGVHATLLPETLLTTKEIDYCVIGEGEYTTLEIVKHVLNNENNNNRENEKNKKKNLIRNIKGIAYNNGGKIVKTPARPLIQNLDELPFPAFHKVNMKYYTKPNPQIIRGVPLSGFYVFTSRGCPYRCRYCVNKNMFGRSIRFRSAKNVVDEIEFLVRKYKLDGVYIYDDTFAVNINLTKAICDEIIKRKLNIIWACETRVNLINEPLLKMLKKAGCVQIDFGIESGSETQLKQLQKDITLEQIRKAFELCKKYKMRTLANFMINLPNETSEDIEYTRKLIKEIKPNITLINVTTPFPGSDLFEQYTKNLTLEDYASMSSKANFNDFIEFIEKKCRLSSHNTPIKKTLHELWKNYPSPQKLYFSLDYGYLYGIYRAVSFVGSSTYIKTILKSRRKTQYFKVIAENIIKSNRSTNA